MTTKEFIEKAIEGGYHTSMLNMMDLPIEEKLVYKTINKIILDHKSWEAVGKVHGWEESVQVNLVEGDFKWVSMYHYKMYQMIDHLVEGGTIESYLETI